MSLDKAIEHGKERRKPYRKPKSFDPWTRNHGKDSWMMGSHKKKKREKRRVAEEQIQEGEL